MLHFLNLRCVARRYARGTPRFGIRPFGGFETLAEHSRANAHGGRTQRIFDHGDLRFVLLALIAEKPRHGYELIKAIEEKVGGIYSPSPGVIYPTLTHLEELGFIQSTASSGTKRHYLITDKGHSFLAENSSQIEAVRGRMEMACRAFGTEPAPELRRAAHNLWTALSLRLARAPLDATQIRTLSDLLDRTAADIERT